MTKKYEDLLSVQELTPLSQILITPELANAFRIVCDVARTPEDVLWASHSSLSLRHGQQEEASVGSCSLFSPLRTSATGADSGNRHVAILALSATNCHDSLHASSHVEACEGSSNRDDMNMKKVKGLLLLGSQDPQEDEEETEEEKGEEGLDENPKGFNENPKNYYASGVQRRPLMVWTPQLHEHFLDAVAHLGRESAVPKRIMHWMEVEGLTRENVASHLQKYRLHLRRMENPNPKTPPLLPPPTFDLLPLCPNPRTPSLLPPPTYDPLPLCPNPNIQFSATSVDIRSPALAPIYVLPFSDTMRHLTVRADESHGRSA